MVILKKLAKRADEKGLPLFLVGGFVRDLLLDYPNLDLDFTLEGDALSFAEEIANEEKLAIKRYPKFGTATIVFSRKIRVDLAQARREVYPVPAGLPEVSPSGITEDLLRRDFTINSMAISVNADQFGELVDPSGGLEDLKVGVIRVHHEKSFIDDPTRIFRAIRFATRYGFAIHHKTLKLIKEAVNSGLIEKLSPARIKNEFIYLLEDLHPVEAILKLDRLGVLRRIHKSFSFRSSVDLLTKIERYPRVKGIKHWFILILALFYNMKLAHSLEIAKRLGFTRRETETLLKLHTLKGKIGRFPNSPSGVYRFANELPKELIVFIMETTPNSSIRESLQRYLLEYRFVKLEVDGHDLKRLGIEEGPIYKEILNKTLDAKLDRGLQSKEEELNFIRKYLGIER